MIEPLTALIAMAPYLGVFLFLLFLVIWVSALIGGR